MKRILYILWFIIVIIFVMMLSGCSKIDVDRYVQAESNQNCNVNDSNEVKAFDAERIESLLQQIMETQKETNELLENIFNAIIKLYQDTNDFTKKITDYITDIQDNEGIDFTPILELIDQFRSEFEQRTLDMTAKIEKVTDKQVTYRDSTNYNYYNTYLTPVASSSDVETDDQEADKDDEDGEHEDGKEDAGDREGFVLTEDTCYESGSTIALDAIEGKTYIYLLRLYAEPLSINLGDDVDANTMSIELYEDNQINTVFLCQEENSVYTEEELDGMFYLVLKGVPAGHYDIGIGR